MPAAAEGESRLTPAMRQHKRFKDAHPDCLLLFRMGDFYELFYDDAVTAHRILGITLTERSEGVPMAGVPYHSVDTYIRRLIEAGQRVAIADQIQDPSEAKGVVDRAVTRVLTPGALVDDSLLQDDRSNNLAAVAFHGAPNSNTTVGVAVVDLSTGAFTVLDCPEADLADELARRGARELLFAETADGAIPDRIARLCESLSAAPTPRPAWQFRAAEALEALLEQTGAASLAGFGLTDDDPAVAPAGAAVRFLRETQSPADGAARLAHLRPPMRERAGDRLLIDGATLRSLEVEQTIRGGATAGSLVGVFFAAGLRTSMGKRLLREWLRSPLRDPAAINARLRCVATLVEDRRTARALDEALNGVQDVARIAARVSLGRATPRDLVALGRSLTRIAPVRAAIENAPAFAAHAEALRQLESTLAPLRERISTTCVDDPPAHLREGGLVRPGVDAQLDEARNLEKNAASWLAEYQQTLAREHDLPNIRVGYNKVFGYYIELPRAQARRAPDAFTRKQTLKNAERYITPELKEFEDRALSARDRAIEREQRIFADLCEESGAHTEPIGRFGDAAAQLDALRCFAEKAHRRSWREPEVVAEPVFELTQGRHPVLEDLLDDRFVPNDLELGAGDSPARLALITGPNMAGKSTYIRQAALIALLAHAGSFVPAQRARIGAADRLFARVGADDALHAGQSTFMVEMTETANILNHATESSLIILDEIGRGTSTLDGLALAWAIAETLASEGLRPRTLFATHYHELTQLEERLPGLVRNLHVAVREWGDEIVFVHRILPGRADRSYGVHVARLAGLPPETITRARELLEQLAVSHADTGVANAAQRARERREAQMSLFREYLPHPALEQLRALDLDRMSPLEAFDALRRLRDAAQGSPGETD